MECGCDVVKFAFGCYCTGHVVLDNLEFVDMIGWKVKVQGVTVVKFGMDKRCCNGVGSMEIKSGTDASEITQVV